MREIYKSSLILFVSCLVYVGSLDGDFVFDDSEAILNNNDVSADTHWSVMIQNDFWGTNVKSNLSHKSYRPFTTWSFRLNKYLSGNRLNPTSFKLTNLIVHALTVQLISTFLTVLFPDLIVISLKSIHHEKSPKDLSIWSDIPFLTSLLFAVHPVHVEAVSGIVGRADLLSAFFFFLTVMYYYVCIPPRERRIEEESESGLRTLYKWFACACVFVFAHLATYSKEIGLTSVVMCCVYDVVIVKQVDVRTLFVFFKLIKDVDREGVVDGSRDSRKSEPLTISNFHWSKFKRKHGDALSRLVVMFLFLLYFVVSRLWFMNFEGPMFQKTDNPAAFSGSLLTKVLTYNYLYFLNIVLLIWPQWLCFDWSMGCVPLLTSTRDPRIVFVAVFWGFIVALLYGAATERNTPHQRRIITMSLCLLVVPYLPASNLIVVVGLVVAERILYVPSLAICLLTALGMHNIVSNTQRSTQKLMKGSFVLLLVVFGLRTNVRSRQWSKEAYLYESALDVCPLNAKVHYNVAKIFGDRGDVVGAELEYRKAIDLHPGYYQAMNNLANLLKDLRRFSEAKTLLNEALEIKEDFPAAWMNLGIVLANLDKPKHSEKAYMKALSYRKRYADCYFNLGNLYLEQRLNELALGNWMEAININPKHERAWNNILSLLYNTDQIERGLTFAQQALDANPSSHKILFNVANIEGKAAKYRDAEEHFLTAIMLAQHNPEYKYYSNLGVLYHRWEKYGKAREMYMKAYKLNNKSKSVLENLKKLPKINDEY